MEGSRGLTGWGEVVSSRRGRFPILLAFCSLLRATAMQLPTLALFWIRARSVWHFFEEKKKYQQDRPVRSLCRNCLEGESRKYMLWDLIDLISHAIILWGHICWVSILHEQINFFIFLPLCPHRGNLSPPFNREGTEAKAPQTKEKVKCLNWSRESKKPLRILASFSRTRCLMSFLPSLYKPIFYQFHWEQSIRGFESPTFWLCRVLISKNAFTDLPWLASYEVF